MRRETLSIILLIIAVVVAALLLSTCESGDNSASEITCGSCGKSFNIGEQYEDFTSVARTGLCVDCYEKAGAEY